MRQIYVGNTVVLDNSYFSLNRFHIGTNPPVFVAPPFAGRDGTVTQRLIDRCKAAGRTVYGYELKPATRETKNLSIAGLVQILNECCDKILTDHGVDKVDLVGCCQGGWLSSLFTSFYPDKVNRLAIFAAPINTRTGCHNVIEDYCETISLPAHKLLVDLNNGIQPGLAQWTAFAMMAPMQIFYGRYIDLLSHIVNGRDHDIAKWKAVNGWYDSPNDLAGVWFLDALENHFCKNKLYNGEWKIGGRVANLQNITCPVFVYAGGKDDITSVEQAKGLLDKVNSTEKHFVVFPEAGHTKVFTGKEELEKFAEMFF